MDLDERKEVCGRKKSAAGGERRPDVVIAVRLPLSSRCLNRRRRVVVESVPLRHDDTTRRLHHETGERLPKLKLG